MNDLKTYMVYRFTRREQINVKKVIPRHGPEGSGNQVKVVAPMKTWPGGNSGRSVKRTHFNHITIKRVPNVTTA